MLGSAAVAMWWDITPEMQAEFEDWHSHEHMLERLAIPGFLRGSRWIALSGESSYFVLYEAAKLATIRRGAYLRRLNNPTPWSRKLMPHHRNMVRSLCLVRASFGAGIAHAMATIRFSPSRKPSASLAGALSRIAKQKGVSGAHLLESQPMAGMRQTTEQKIRGGDAAADWVLLVCGYDADALETAVAKDLAGALSAPAVAFYRLSYTLSAKEAPRSQSRRAG
jgi:hypothetical protein